MKPMLSSAALALLVATACASSDAEDDMSRDDVAAFELVLEGMENAATDYRLRAEVELVSLDTCRTLHQSHDDAVRPLVYRAVSRAGAMDGYMHHHGGGMGADLECAASRALDELEQHAKVACTKSELQLNRNEAIRHADRMRGYAVHMRLQCSWMMTNLDDPSSTAMPVPVLTECESW